MPTRIRVGLEAAVAGAFPLPQTAPAVNAAVLGAVAAVDPALAQGLHDAGSFKPFAVTPLLDEREQAVGRRSREAWFEVGLLVDQLTATVVAALGAQQEYRVGTTRYRVKDVAVVSGQPYEAIAARARPRTAWGFRLLTPTGFASALEQGARRELPWPDPARVFGNLADRWRTFAPDVELPDGLEDALRGHLAVAAYELHTAEHLVKTGAPMRTGAVGHITYRVAEARQVQRPVLAALDALAHYAEFAGIGDRTAMGMGVVRQVEPDRRGR